MTGTKCGLFTHKSVPVIFVPPCIYQSRRGRIPEDVNLEQRCCEKLKPRASVSSLHSAGTSNVHLTVDKL